MKNWDYAAKIATEEGRLQGSFMWWSRIREILKERNIPQNKELEEVELSNFDFRGYRVIDSREGTELDFACGQFKYKNRVISFSNHFPNEVSVAVFKLPVMHTAESTHKSVQEAIKYVDGIQ